MFSAILAKKAPRQAAQHQDLLLAFPEIDLSLTHLVDDLRVEMEGIEMTKLRPCPRELRLPPRAITKISKFLASVLWPGLLVSLLCSPNIHPCHLR